MPPLMANMAGVGMELMALVEFVELLSHKGKGEGETLGYGKNNKEQGI